MKTAAKYLVFLFLIFSCSEGTPKEPTEGAPSPENSESYNDTLDISPEIKVGTKQINSISDTIVFKNPTAISLNKTQEIAVPKEIIRNYPMKVGVVKNGKIINVKIAEPYIKIPNKVETMPLDTGMIVAPPPAPPSEEI